MITIAVQKREVLLADCSSLNLKEILNASKLFEHPPNQGENSQNFRRESWVQRVHGV